MARWIGDATRGEVHDFWGTRTNCQIRAIAPEARHDFDSISEAHEAGLRHCPWCIGDVSAASLETADIAVPQVPCEPVGAGSLAA